MRLPVIPAITDRLGRLATWRQPENGHPPSLDAQNEPILRAELYSVEQLERHAVNLATSHQLATGPAGDKLLPRLEDNERVLVRTYDMVTAAVAVDRRIAPAAEWLLDNFYLIEEQIRTARRHLPASYSRELPRLANGPAARYPRAYAIALELISHVDGRVDAGSLNAFIAAYQTVRPLKLGELWAVPIMLRLALIENLRRVATHVAEASRDRDLAADWAEKMVRVVEENPTDLVIVMADMARANPPFSGPFMAEMTRHLQGQSPYFAFVNSWLEHRVSVQGMTVEQLVRTEGQAQAADQVSMGNSISGLRVLSSSDWREFVERQSLVEKTLHDDPAGVYASMDFITRDQYRHQVEEMARRSRRSEYEVANQAIQLARMAADTPGDRKAHVGYYLVDRGRSVLEKIVDSHLSPSAALVRIARRFPLFIYTFGVTLTSVGVTSVFLNWAGRRGVDFSVLCVLAILTLLCVAHLGVAVVNWLITVLVPPRPLPRMDYREGVPVESRTMVVVPTILSNADGVDSLLEGIEVRYLANRSSNLHFALLTDLEDAGQEVLPADEDLVRQARKGIEQLNLRYKRPDLFFLFHRPRRWNDHERVWMGYERERGKLAELNGLLRGAPDRFACIEGDRRVLSDVRYVITLDTDTQLPRDAAREMIAAMAHILNRPVFDARHGQVVQGYSILQPRVGVTVAGAADSWFVRLFGGDPGIDPYTRVTSDVYQDLFDEGTFIGKGIYDVDAFEQRCAQFPENAILSHDLLESAYARSGLLSDVVLYETYPSAYPADVSRRHRWIRGDWQIAEWLLPRVPGLAAPRVENPISGLSRWKIFDNLRRSVVPIAMLALLLLSWLVLWRPLGGIPTLLVLITMVGAPLMALMGDLVRKPPDRTPWTHIRLTAYALRGVVWQFLFVLVFLPYDACVSLDAIGRTMVRMVWTKRRLLQWKTSSDAERTARKDLPGFLRSMGASPGVSAVTVVLLCLFQPDALPVASPLLALWLVSPVAAWWLSRPIAPRAVLLTEKQIDFLGQVSRRTWHFFEVFVAAEENWLPPDNVQENPLPVVATRTSPTNMGMALLANLAAYDFGYCSAGKLMDRTRKSFTTFARMERYRGHFYNWYDTRSLEPLPPRYISMVDSGNLAGHLLVLRCGLLGIAEAKVLPARVSGGLRDTARVMLEVAVGPRPAKGETPLVPGNVLRKIERLEAELEREPATLSAAAALLARISVSSAEITAESFLMKDVQEWSEALERSCTEQRDDLMQVAPWLELPPPPVGTWTDGSQEGKEKASTLHTHLLRLDAGAILSEVAALEMTLLPAVDALLSEGGGEAAAIEWLGRLRGAIQDAAHHAADRIKTLIEMAQQCHELADMDFSFLFDKMRNLFAIGYNVSDQRLDSSYYDLLASEARLGSFVAIAEGQIGQEHWFSLGRMITSTAGLPALLSWSGTMFEYLMPLLVMPTYPNTLLDQTYRAAVRRQIDYGRQRGVPWGISESGYNTVDAHMNYQYRAFGVPGLALKRGLADDLVVTPYATALALMVAPEEACKNLELLAADGNLTPCGFYEAVDYTPSRLPPGTNRVIVRQFMAHHSGMSLLALAYLLLDKPMQRRFEADPMFRANELLLQERVPRDRAPVFPHASEAGSMRTISPDAEGSMRVFIDPSGPAPDVHLLSNGRYHVVITSAGGGYSHWGDLAVTRWREDPTRDCWGTFCYLRDVDSGTFWSTAWQPTARPARSYEAIFTNARAEFRRQDEGIESHTEISVSPEDDVELRRTTMTNRSEVARTIEVTSYAEVILAPLAQDLAHPAFSNLFVETELVPHREAIICTRRPRSPDEHPPWMVHQMTVRGTTVGTVSFETDRTKFIGRGRTPAAPVALTGKGRLSDSQGPVLDPVVSIRQTIRLKPNETVQVHVISGVAETREVVTALMEKYDDPRLADRVFELAWTHSKIRLQQLNAGPAEAQAYSRLAGSVIYASPLLRAPASVLSRNRRGQSGLWGYGISGDLPIVLVRIRDRSRIDLVRQSVQAHAFWRLKGLAVDLIIWNEDDALYMPTLQDTIIDVIASGSSAAMVDKPGGIFVRRGEQMSDEDRLLLQAVARVVLQDDAGTLMEQADRRGRSVVFMPALKPPKPAARRAPERKAPERDLEFFNGLGGFSRDGREYVITLGAGQTTPAPWVNVIANSQFGTVVSESGSSYTWSENSHEFRLTPWVNDPVSDASGEAMYIRDEETGRFWSPSPLPAPGDMPYVARHGFGYSFFETEEDGIFSELCIYVAPDAPVKFARLRMRNRSGRGRQLSVTGYWEWVLGELRNKTLMHVITTVDPKSGALFARNSYDTEFVDRVAFVDCSESVRTMSGDRTEFLGRNGTPANPAALRRVRLSGRVGAGLDPCAAMMVPVVLEDGHDKEVVFILGAAPSEERARQLASEFRSTAAAQKALEGVWTYWSRALGTVYVETPDTALNFLANGWLMYQVLACRMWARTGLYQSGGAYGFRDQLQDAMAVLHADPAVLRKHLLRAAGHQFVEGDVQHWWHPPAGRGVRTHFSDDFLWLPYAACRYVTTTGDTGVLEERVRFLTSRAVRPEEEAYYDLPQISDEVADLYDHCVRAIDNGLRFGVHGLPLMGCGDWNDGMNLVGAGGKGESVWLAFFLFDVLTRFYRVARARNDGDVADRYEVEAGRLRGHIEQNGWDGEWYRRAFFDDGEPLGSSTNPECQIDSLPQSWSVLTGAGPRERSRVAMDSVARRLVHTDSRVIQLFTPPFDQSSLNPGYIKGYPPGVRENGGQYTHAAVWTVMAFAALGQSKTAWELFSLINPIRHGTTNEEISTYRVEPYVMAADVYGAAPNSGRGGWTWYTGSAGWMYRLITESLLGLHLDVDRLRFSPCLPESWPSFKIHYRYRETFFHITFHNEGNGTVVKRVVTDGVEQPEMTVLLVDDRNDHSVEIDVGEE